MRSVLYILVILVVAGSRCGHAAEEEEEDDEEEGDEDNKSGAAGNHNTKKMVAVSISIAVTSKLVTLATAPVTSQFTTRMMTSQLTTKAMTSAIPSMTSRAVTPTEKSASSCTQPQCMPYHCAVNRKKFAADGITLNPVGKSVGKWYKLCNRTYFLSKSMMTWIAAQEMCCSLNLTLISLDTLEEQNCLTRIVSRLLPMAYTIWTSGSDKKCKGKYWWCTNHTPLSTSLRWQKNSPDNNGGKEDCLAIELKVKSKAASEVELNDRECSMNNYYACESYSGDNILFSSKDEYQDEDAVFASKQKPCQQPQCLSFKCKKDAQLFMTNGTRIVSDKLGRLVTLCGQIYMLSNVKASWTKAQEVCCALNMRLLSLETKGKQDCIMAEIAPGLSKNDFYWTSGSDRECEGNFWWCNIGSKLNSDITWKIGQPENKKNGEDCVSLEKDLSLGLNDRVCTDVGNFICESGENAVLTSRNKGKVNNKVTCTKPSCKGLSSCHVTEENSTNLSKDGKFLVPVQNMVLLKVCGKKYIFGTKKRFFVDVLKDCCSFGMRVTNIETAEEFQCLDNAFKENFKSPMSFFTGGTNLDCPNVWGFCLTDTLLYPGAKWRPGQPDGKEGKQNSLILELLPRGGTASGFKDDVYYGSFNMLCESGQQDASNHQKSAPEINSAAVTKEPSRVSTVESSMRTSITSRASPTSGPTSRQITTSTVTVKSDGRAPSRQECSEPMCLLDACKEVSKSQQQEALAAAVSTGEILSKQACGAVFAFGLKKKGFEESQSFCCSLGMRLISVLNNDKHNCVTTMHRGLSLQGTRSYWVHATDYGCKGKWMWCDSRQKLTPNTMWGEGQPSRGWMKDCVTLQLGEKISGFYDAVCVMEQNYPLCEDTSLGSDADISSCPCPAAKCGVKPPSSEKEIKVPSSFGVSKVACKKTYVFSKKQKNLSEASEACCSLAMTLLTLDNAQELQCLQDMYAVHFLESKDFWTSGASCRGSLTWCLVRGSNVTWRDEVVSKTREECVALTLITEGDEEKSSGAFPQSCAQNLPFICET